ncbi:hypothetical protein CR513_48305, partial [Mucuna pruriens]
MSETSRSMDATKTSHSLLYLSRSKRGATKSSLKFHLLFVVASSCLINVDTTPPFSFFLLCMHSSLRNFVYFGICFIALRSGMLISTLLNIFNKSSSLSNFLVGTVQAGKGSGTLAGCYIRESTFGSDSTFTNLGICCGGNSLPLRNVTMLTPPFGFEINRHALGGSESLGYILPLTWTRMILLPPQAGANGKQQ